MKNIKAFLIVAALTGIVFLGFRSMSLSTWKIIPDGVKIIFTGKSTKGTLDSLSAEIEFGTEDLAGSSFSATIKTSSIDLGKGLQTKHARSDNWMDVEKYPEITFKSTQVMKIDEGFAVKGMLTIKDVSKEVTIPFSFTETDTGGLFTGGLHIIRDDYKIGKEGGSFVPEVDVVIEVPVVSN